MKGRAKDAWQAFNENAGPDKLQHIRQGASEKINILRDKAINSFNHGNDGDYSHVYRYKFIIFLNILL